MTFHYRSTHIIVSQLTMSSVRAKSMPGRNRIEAGGRTSAPAPVVSPSVLALSRHWWSPASLLTISSVTRVEMGCQLSLELPVGVGLEPPWHDLCVPPLSLAIPVPAAQSPVACTASVQCASQLS